MSNKDLKETELDRALKRLVTPSVFDRLVREIDASEVPATYIEQIVVHFNNGSTVELSGKEISNPIPVNRDGNWEEMGEAYKNIKEVKVFIDTQNLETDVNGMVEDYLGGRC